MLVQETGRDLSSRILSTCEMIALSRDSVKRAKTKFCKEEYDTRVNGRDINVW
jgi:hypothetical protein